MTPLVALFREVLDRPLAPGMPEGRVRIELIGPSPAHLSIDLRTSGCAIAEDEQAELIVWLSPQQLERMAKGEASEELRHQGDRALLRSLASVLEPAQSSLSVRFER